MPQLKPRTREDLAVADFGDELVVCETEHGHAHVHHLNPSAALVFRICDGTGTVGELAADIADLYGLPQGSLEHEVRSIVRGFRRNGLLTAKPVVRRSRQHDHDHLHEADGHEHDDAHEHPRESRPGFDQRGRIRREVPESE